MHSIHMKSGRDTTHLKTTRRLSLKHWSTKTVIFSAESWPCFQIEPAAGAGKTPFLDNLIQMLTFDIGLSILRALLPPQNPLRVFAPRSPERSSRHGSGSALSATGNRLGRTPDPHRCNTDGLRPPTNRVAACTVQMGFAGGWRGSWRPESPWLGVSARLTS